MNAIIGTIMNDTPTKLHMAKACLSCGLQKPIAAFLIGRDESGRPIYGAVCGDCRNKKEDADESGRKKYTLKIDHENRDFSLKKQIEKAEDKETVKKEYLEEQDLLHEELLEESEKDELSTEDENSLNTNKEKEVTKEASEGEKKTALSANEYSDAYSRDPNVSDPHRQNPNLAPEEGFFTNTSRLDFMAMQSGVGFGGHIFANAAVRSHLSLGGRAVAASQAQQQNQQAATQKKQTAAKTTLFQNKQETAQQKQQSPQKQEPAKESTTEVSNFISRTWGMR